MQNRYVDDLIRFIKANADWREKLLKKPYALKSIIDVPYIENCFMFNYNLFESDLSNPVVKACRGTIMQISPDCSIVKPICLPYYKFFNAFDPNEDEINWETATCHTKIDGQLIKMFKYNGENYWCTNGSPNLETPLDYGDEKIGNYKELLEAGILQETIDSLTPSKCRKNHSFIDGNGAWHMCMDIDATSWINKIPDGWTLMFELCSPYNRIIVKHNDIKLWFHGGRDPEGLEHRPEEIVKLFDIPFDIPESCNFENINKVLDYISDWKGDENEGIVVCDDNFHRVKIKCNDYLKIKFIRDIDTPKGIFWIVISEEYDDLVNYPELQKKAEEQKIELVEVLEKLRAIHKVIFDKRQAFETQKDFALWVLETHKEMSSFIFSAAKNSEDIFIDNIKTQLKCESSGYEKYLSLKKLIEEGVF